MADMPTERDHRQVETVHELSVVVARGADAGKTFHGPPKEGAQVGSSADCDLVLTDPKVSHYHLELTPADDGIAVRDLGSLNGTFVGGARVRDATVVRGTQIRLGDTLLVVDAASAPRTREDPPAIPGLVYRSAIMRELARSIEKVAAWNGAVLIQGETGTGKELVAAAIHAKSPRAQGPFVILDCGALPGTLVASELFGHERGAFTGADRRAIGAFERADGGTIFLDEIGELPLAIQPALLGVLQRKKIRRVGGDKEIPVDVRVLSATHRDLRGDVNRKAFREDLYYRIAGARVFVPPLRDREGDLPLLVRHFASEITGTTDEPPGLAAAMPVFEAQTWPGNVRELRNAVERAIFEGGPKAEDAAEGARAGEEATVERYRDARAAVITAFEVSYVTSLMQACEGNASEAARRAGMDRPYLLSLLKKHGLR
jgi:transcriptional regulator with GAF, ATPase, and Fis domain